MKRFDPAATFLLRAFAWIVVLFGLLRLTAVQNLALIPLARFEQSIANWCFEPTGTVAVGISCTGYDALALCLGVILAFPVPWRSRLIGACAGFVWISLLNTLRIGTLSVVVADPELFHLYHVYLWPAALVALAVLFVWMWIRWVQRRAGVASATLLPVGGARSRPWLFTASTVVLLGLYFLLFPALLKSPWLEDLAAVTAGLAAGWMRWIGIPVEVARGLLRTPRGAWVVTPECILTPLIPVYLALVIAFASSWKQRLGGLVAVVPLFVGLGVCRLMVLAVPAQLVGASDLAVHAFYQVVLSVLLVGWMAHRGRRRRWLVGALVALGVGTLIGVLFARLDQQWIVPLLAQIQDRTGHASHVWSDGQGAMSLFPGFQVGLTTALLVAAGRRLRWRSWAVAGGLLVGFQAALRLLSGELAAHLVTAPAIVVIRALAVAVPVVLALWLSRGSWGHGDERDGEVS